MEKKNRKPAWWQLYLLIPVMALLLGAAQVDPRPGVSKSVTDILIIVFTFGSMFVWIWANRDKLDEDYMDRYPFDDEVKITVYEPYAQQEKNRELSHGAPPLANYAANKIEENIAKEELKREE